MRNKAVNFIMQRIIILIGVCLIFTLFSTGCEKDPKTTDKIYVQNMGYSSRGEIEVTIRSEAQKIRGTNYYAYIAGDSEAIASGRKSRITIFSIDSTYQIGNTIKVIGFYSAGFGGFFPVK